MAGDRNVNRRIAIIDPCYHKKGGHHHGVNLSLARELSWLDPNVYTDTRIELDRVSVDYPSAATILPFFSESGYISPQRYSTVSSYCEQSRRFCRQLRAVDADILIGHTLLHFHLYGLGLYLAREKNKLIVISLMFSPYEGLRAQASEQKDYCFSSIALRSLNDAALSNGHKITLGVTSEYHWELIAGFREDFRFISFTRSPWLVGIHNAGTALRAGMSSHCKGKEFTRSKVLLYLGDAKPDKGIETVREFLKWVTQLPACELARASSICQIEVHITHCDEWLQTCVDEIRLLCGILPSLTQLYEEHYSSRDYFRTLARANKIVWLYDPDNYRYRTSGIFYDAVSIHESTCNTSAPPDFVVSQGSWMEKEFQLLGFEPTVINLSDNNWMNSLWQILSGVESSLEPRAQPDRDLVSVYKGQSWNDWVVSVLRLDEQRLLIQIAQMNLETRPLIVISTDYPHFTRLSGPTGFVQYLDGALHFKTHLGKSKEFDWLRSLTGLKSATDDALRLETELISLLKNRPMDIICVDGEHAGSLLGLALRDQQLHPDTRIYTWFHQPTSILAEDIIDPSTFPAAEINPICISPCQVGFFVRSLKIDRTRVSVIPHGVHAELITIGQQASLRRSERRAANGLGDSFKMLTVGNWLRDRALLFKAAKACPAYEFVWVSTGMTLQPEEHAEAKRLGNLKIITSGLSNQELHYEYMTSDFLFQPLIAATANNAIIESMAFGLPIITKKLESTVYYTSSNAIYYSDDADAITLLKSIKTPRWHNQGDKACGPHYEINKLEWGHIAHKFIDLLSRFGTKAACDNCN
jgi:glycosyltransferase involved in cell wall biosynthesis